MSDHACRKALRAAEDELQTLRGFKADVVAFIHMPAYDADARRALAERLGLPIPAQRPAPRPSRPASPGTHSAAVRAGRTDGQESA
ncbi:hypothetical protein AB0H07_39025 [Streptomyces sp. NPDC021354]|uniref:hypothetical protein n=1 Tax=Streptomyces sp. NPDC021354 TaxID=3154793 RepID=UPI0033F53963